MLRPAGPTVVLADDQLVLHGCFLHCDLLDRSSCGWERLADADRDSFEVSSRPDAALDGVTQHIQLLVATFEPYANALSLHRRQDPLAI